MSDDVGPCTKCGGDLAFRYANRGWLIECLACGHETMARTPRYDAWELDARAMDEIGG